MKIKTRKVERCWDEIPVGGVFEQSGDLYYKMDDKGRRANCFNVLTGVVMTHHKSTVDEVLDYEIPIENIAPGILFVAKGIHYIKLDSGFFDGEYNVFCLTTRRPTILIGTAEFCYEN